MKNVFPTMKARRLGMRGKSKYPFSVEGCTGGCSHVMVVILSEALTPAHILLQRFEEESVCSHAVFAQPGSAEIG